MKGVTAYLVCVITLVRGVEKELNKNNCPLDYKNEMLLPHKMCNKFYQCKHGELVEHTCAADLLFNIELQKCNWSYITKCGNRIIPEYVYENKHFGGNGNGDSQTVDKNNEIEYKGIEGNIGQCNCDPGEAPSICARSGSDDVLVTHENCTQFYKCANGKPVALSCPGSLYYDPIKGICDWPEKVNCGDRIKPECDNNNGGSGSNNNQTGDNNNGDGDNGNGDNTGSCNCNPSEAPSICARSGSDGVLIAHENCALFYKCANGKPAALSCPGSLFYNPILKYCDWPENVNCGERVKPECDNNSEGSGNGGNQTGDNNNGSGDNGNGDNTGSCNCNPSEAPSICARSGSDGVLIAHENCAQFYKCANGKPVPLSCPGSLFYNPITGSCDWPENVECGDRIIVENDISNESNGNDNNQTEDNNNGSGDDGNGDNTGSCNCNPSEAPSICARSGSDGVLIAHENCAQFYKCANGKPVPLTCPGSLFYNPVTGSCDWPENVECGDRIIVENDISNESSGNDNNQTEDSNNGDGDNGNGDNTGSCNCNPSEAPSLCASFGSDGVLIAHENCTQFYKCANGKPVSLSCPGSLYYDPIKGICDWPEKVNCGDRIKPECDNNNGGSGSNNNQIGDNNNGSGDDGNGDNTGSCNCNPSEAPSICARSGSDGVLIAHENCAQFYKCANGKPVPLSCPGSLFYNPVTRSCDWPENVECGDRIIIENDISNESSGNDNNQTGDNNNGSGDNGNGDNTGSCNCNPSEAPSICASFGSDGVLIAHENCAQFYKCANGKPVSLSCPGSLYYDPIKGICDWPEKVNCGEREKPECDNNNGGSGSNNNQTGDNNNGSGDDGNGDNTGSCNCNPSEAPSICARSGSDGILIAHENCAQFYKCANGKPVPLSCPGSLFYNPVTRCCDWPENVECGDRIIIENDISNESSGNDNNQTGDNNNGSGDNGNGDNTGSCNCNPSEAPSICASFGSDGVLIAHENCAQFYKCANGKPVSLSCPGSLYYDPIKGICDWPEKVNCGEREKPECDNNNGGSGSNNNQTGDNNNGSGDDGNGDNTGSCNCNPSEAPSICARSGSDGILIAHENCAQFYKCANGKPVPLSCPGSLFYNPVTKSCDWPENVECGDRIIIENDISNESSGNDNNQTGDNNNGSGDNGNGDNTGSCNCNPSEAPSICARSGSDGILIAHENCAQFYKCANGKPVPLSCPGSLFYNPVTRSCDWPENVECGDRIIIENDISNESSGNDNNQTGDNNNGSGDNGNGDNTGSCNCNPSEAPSICASFGSDGVLIAHENCAQFYKCANGKPVSLSCPGSLYYDPIKGICDWPEKVNCGEREKPECDNNNGGSGSNNNQTGDNNNGSGDDENGDNTGSCNCNPSEAPSICARSGSDGILIAHENCAQFYKCANGKPVPLSCPGSLFYNPVTRSCDWPENVECGDRIIIENDISNESSGNDNNQTGDNNNGSGDNGNGDNTGSCNCNPSEAPSICASFGSDGVLIAHENCAQFYKCANGKPVSLSCPGSLYYDPIKGICDWPEKVNCGEREKPECDNNNGGSGSNNNQTEDNNNGSGDNGNGDNTGSCNCNPSEAPSICASFGSDGVLIAHENCAQFYKCANGKPVSLSCPGSLYYDPIKGICDWPEKVNCGEREKPECDNNNGGSGSNNNQTGDNNNGSGDDGNGDNTGSCNCNPSEAPSICARSGSDGILIAHENCAQFYKCANGKPVPLSCPGSLFYNPVTRSCDWPENVECGDRIIIENDISNESSGNDNNQTGDNNNGSGDNGNGDNTGSCNCNPSEAPSICASFGSDGVLIAHENCAQFYKCANGKPVSLSCPGSLYYDPIKGICDWPEKVNCGEREKPECDNNNGGSGSNNNQTEDNNNGDGDNGNGDNTGSCNCNPSEAPSICARSGSDGILIAHENCAQFYKCANGKPVPLSCPGSLFYNPVTRSCDWPENVECGDRIIIENDISNESSGNDNNQTGDNNNGSGDNGNGDNTGSCNCNPSEAPSICASFGSDGVLIAHENCAQFYKCANGKPVSLSCPGSLYYDPIKGICDWPEKVNCGEREKPECDNNNGGSGSNNNQTEDNNNGDGDNGNGDNTGSCNCNPSEAPSICARSGSDGVLIAHENCSQFYKCANGKPVPLSCPGSLFYNPVTGSCDWPENVECGDRIIVENDISNESSGNDNNQTEDSNNGDGDNGNGDNTGSCNCNPSEAPSLCASFGSDGVLIAHENCTQFYKCANGKPVSLSCPGSLYYDPIKGICDWPEKVNCGDRIKPECDNNNGGSGSNNNQTGDYNNGSGDNGNGDNTGSCNCNPSEAPSICARSGSDGVLIAHENCAQFYKCANGKPVPLSCPGPLLYNPITEHCDWSNRVDCVNRIIIENENNNEGCNGENDTGDKSDESGDNIGSCKCNPRQAASICARSESDGILVAHEHCNKFYKCIEGLPVAFSCYGDFLFNPYTQQCEWPLNVTCGNRIVLHYKNDFMGIIYKNRSKWENRLQNYNKNNI